MSSYIRGARFVLLFIISNIILLPEVTAVDRGRLCVFKIALPEKQKLFKELEKEEEFAVSYEITPTTYIFKYNGKETLSHPLQRVIVAHKGQIEAVEPVIIQVETTNLEGKFSYNDGSFHKDLPDLTNSNYYGMGIEEAWSKGYTGKGVTIATMGVGIDTDLKDLEGNINQEWCYNFVQNSENVAVEHFHDVHPEMLHVTDHGNRIASILAAVKGNNICSAGIAYNATVVVLKVYQFTLFDNDEDLRLSPTHWTASDITARALVYKLGEIDISVMAWSSVTPFDKLDLATREALTYGAKTGRRGLGRIHVVSAGPSGNELTNNIYTITINGIGRGGTISESDFSDTSVLVSGLSDGNNLTSTYMITTTVNNACTAWFKGVSAATSQVAAIIGLALQANPSLTLRDIQHLLVQSAEYNGLDETYAFRRNGAGRYYHRYFGFGLLNATKLVTLAKKRQKATALLDVKLEQTTEKISDDIHSFEYKFCHCCNDSSEQPCLTVVEHVVISLEFETTTKQLRMDLTSPSGTRSVLLKETKGLKRTTSGQLVSVNFWDELALGEWKFNLQSSPSLKSSSQANVTRISIALYGTSMNQKDVKAHSCCHSGNVNVEYETKRPKQQPDQPSDNIVAERLLYLAVVFSSLGIALVLAKIC